MLNPHGSACGVQAHARARPPLPKPTVLPPLPMLAGPQEALLGGPLPTELAAVYEAAGAGHALQQLEALVGLKTGSIPPPGSGGVPIHLLTAPCLPARAWW